MDTEPKDMEPTSQWAQQTEIIIINKKKSY